MMYFEGKLEKTAHVVARLENKSGKNPLVHSHCKKLWIGFPGTLKSSPMMAICDNCVKKLINNFGGKE
jgi:hypothetical protein